MMAASSSGKVRLFGILGIFAGLTLIGVYIGRRIFRERKTKGDSIIF